ncbi:rhomboid-like protein 20 isoform X1 [Populus alba]|uniref:rhomboid-like protein 20 isoform X1 n=1 Tax=Populus alba TaxID=43335 RepID=UPI00158E1B2A|nr:rhomboid-like protein 20 isoform X1 [Populus alba]
MNGGPSGFNNAPVTKTFVIASAIFTIFLRIKGGPNKLGLSYQDIFWNPHLWKLILSVFAFSSTPEMMFGLYLLYYFRVFERQIGSNKYLVFILFSVIVSLLFEVFAVALLKGDFSANVLSAALQSCPTIKCVCLYADPSANLPTSGPYGLIFASFVPFYFDIPVSTRFHIFSNHFSDKSFIYLAGVQLLLSSWKRSILPGICGILAGSLYRLNLFGIRKAKFPELIASFFSWLSWPSTGSPRGATTRNVTGSALSHAGRHVERTYPAPMAPSTEPTEDAIATLVSMGFDRSSARQALVQARNDINTATNILLEAVSH